MSTSPALYNNGTELLMQIMRFSDFENDIMPLFKNALVKRNVESNEARYRTINVADSMRKLEAIGQLLSLAFAGTKGFCSNVSVVEMLCKYQTLVKDSQLACNSFLMACMKAQQYHKMAIRLASKDVSSALKALGMVSNLADKMITLSGGLVNQSSAMVGLAERAISATTNDENISIAERRKINAMLTELNAEKQKLESKTKALVQQIKDATEKEKNAMDEADTARTRAFITSIISTVAVPLVALAPMACSGAKAVGMGVGAAGVAMAAKKESDKSQDNRSDEQKQSTPAPVTYVSSKQRLMTDLSETKTKIAQAKSELTKQSISDEKKLQLQNNIELYEAEEKELKEQLKHANDMDKEAIKQANNQAMSQAAREARYHVERVNLQEIEREANADLAAALEKLKGAQNEKNSLDIAVRSLGFATKALVRVKTVFENTRMYWETVKAHCEDLASGMNKQHAEFYDFDSSLLVDDITLSWYSWIALGNINYTALSSLNIVVEKLDCIMNDLPTMEEAEKRLPDLIKWLETEVQKDNKQTVNAIHDK